MLENGLRDNNGRTPLWLAAYHGQDDLNLNNSDNYGQTPLMSAAWGGHEGVVKMLLARDNVNPDKPNISGRTPLW